MESKKAKTNARSLSGERHGKDKTTKFKCLVIVRTETSCQSR